MVNALKDAMVSALVKYFGAAISILETPPDTTTTVDAFYIEPLSITRTQKLGRRYFQQNPMKVYFASPERDLQETANGLYDALAWIEVSEGDLMKGTAMGHEVVEGVLQFSVQYNQFVIQQLEEDNAMAALNYASATQES